MHVQLCTLNRCRYISVHICYKLATGCAYALMYVQFVHSALGNEGRRVQLVYEGTCCLAWGVVYDRRRDRGV